ncbi:MAG: bifunctional 4-hydroxy-2-oxoglutarate aldolase/2-dehydro-3-deoxy-phosphogluconate aldolase [Verrucomicrobiae bacterium]|nr:bifunctional 4-hydroxy-2-oxoglutarate aldolase/2-dehydro-3-deoxy-phosphogluconate aldolase [Verrucomicrobiae bacterium]
MFPEDLHNQIKASKVVAVLVIDEARHAVPVARALLRGGISAMELTLRTQAALPALQAIRQEVPEMLAGIGTILTTHQVDQVVEAGAAFGVAPGTNAKIIQYALDRGLPFGPGIMTPSDIEAAIELGCRTLKYFPAETSGGLKHLSGIVAPYQHLGLDFIPLGGLNSKNMAEYLRSPLISAIGGSWIAKKDVINAEDWDTIEKNAREAREIADSI